MSRRWQLIIGMILIFLGNAALVALQGREPAPYSITISDCAFAAVLIAIPIFLRKKGGGQ